MRISNLEQKAERSYFPYRFRRITIEKIMLGFLTERQACEKYGVTLKLVRQRRHSYYKHRILPHLITSYMKSKKNKEYSYFFCFKRTLNMMSIVIVYLFILTF